MVVLSPAGIVHDDLHQLGQSGVTDGDEGGGDGGLALGQDVDDERREADDPRADQASPDELGQPPGRRSSMEFEWCSTVGKGSARRNGKGGWGRERRCRGLREGGGGGEVRAGGSNLFQTPNQFQALNKPDLF